MEELTRARLKGELLDLDPTDLKIKFRRDLNQASIFSYEKKKLCNFLSFQIKIENEYLILGIRDEF